MDQWITLRCTSSYPLIHSPYCYGVLPHQTKVTEQPAILPKCFWHTGCPTPVNQLPLYLQLIIQFWIEPHWGICKNPLSAAGIVRDSSGALECTL